MKWTKWGVLGYMRSYLSLFFPGREADARNIGLIVEDADEQVNSLENGDECKDDDDVLDLI